VTARQIGEEFQHAQAREVIRRLQDNEDARTHDRVALALLGGLSGLLFAAATAVFYVVVVR